MTTTTFKREVGAELRGDECFFKVWAPNARAVYPIFKKPDGWQLDQSHKLSLVGEYWEGIVKGVHENDQYKFLIIPKNAPEDINIQEFQKFDPAAKDVANSGITLPSDNACILVNADFDWAPFITPKFENFIIYQLHVGTFAGYNDSFSAEIDRSDAKMAQYKHVAAKLGYIKEMGFDAIELLPVQEFSGNQSWGYNPSFYNAPESSYGSPTELRQLVNEAHKAGLAVIFDVVFNHVTSSDGDNPLLDYDVNGQKVHLSDFVTDWGRSLAYWQQKVKDFFVDNLKMYIEEYKADGFRFDATRAIEANKGWDADGWKFLQDITWRIKEQYPDKYLTAEHLPDHDTIITNAGLHATWMADAHHEFQKALESEFHPEYGDPLDKLKYIIGKNFGYGRNYPNQWNLVKYILGSHDECGDMSDGAVSDRNPNINDRKRYLTQFLGGRDNWYARAKARLAWSVNVAAMGTPMLFMGSECHADGYWHDQRGHWFNWAIAGDPTGMPMRRLVQDANWVRWNNPALRSEELQIVHEDYANKILAFKRWVPGGNNVVLVVVNLSDRNFLNRDYSVRTGGQRGQWSQIFCSQDARYGGWEGAGNAFYNPWTFDYGDIFININVPKYSVVMMQLVNYQV